ncbi:MAG: CBS domain-containing protein [Limimaricola sp.]|uniref:CBS domain-containing protein n=1 Tax=Limimaricola sp. TaxID=2211665 RepID=UPI001DAAEC10|nr:CBS domain-containing protein [Limimaricola sp.]MBI1418383.1 CBS domain-containing protein [Limimaricola sp.]
MLVHQILSSKPAVGVLTISPEASVGDAVALLSSKKIGAVVVSRDGVTAEGIVSERDIVRELGNRGTGCLTEAVAAIMTRKLVTCGKEDSADRVMQVMTEGRFRHLPVLEGGRMVGLVSIGDVVKARLAELAMEKHALEGMIMGH